MSSLKEYSALVPFDIYDFFGYIFPGVFFVVSTLAYLGHSQHAVLEHHQQIWVLYEKAPILMSAVLLIGGIVCLYILGHFIATVSHIIIDRVMVDGIVGYPVTHLLRLPRHEREYSESTYKYLFGVFNAILLAPIILDDYQTLKLVMWVLGGMFAVLLVLRIIVMLMRADPKRRRILVPRIAANKWMRLYLLPAKMLVNPTIGFIRRMLGIDRRFPGQFIRQYKRLFRKSFGMDPSKVESENYWLPFFYMSTTRPGSTGMVNTWLHLYGFSRNSSAAAYLSAGIIIFLMLLNPSSFGPATRIQLAVLYVVACVFGLRYWLLYSTYYTKNIIRAFVECALSSEEPDL